ncbi:MAG: D-alanine--D-alanine ligase [Cyclobacteriaceae bacterium]|nr:D-alanine--D-alanine ligase [Cyclobacteriaceae bacterium]
MSEKLNIGLLYGGRSVEHQISVLSAKNVYENIDKNKFIVTIIGIDRLGKWYLMNSIDSDFNQGSPLRLSLDASSPKFIDSKKNTYEIDVAFPVLHGTDGEDGSIQGLLKAMNIPFAGSGVLGSSISMDKLIAKQLLFQAGIPVSKYISFTIEERNTIDYNNVVEKIGLPFMVKPANLGSSVGINKVTNENEYVSALNHTFQFDTTVLLEEFIVGRELECAILGNSHAKASNPGEIIISDNYDFYTYEAKYEDKNAVDIQIPAKIDDDIAEQMKKLCIKSYKTLKCEDFARVDLFLTATGKIFINEINTIPGFTNISMFPTLWEQHGIKYKSLISKIINLALDRDKKTKEINRSYIS